MIIRKAYRALHSEIVNLSKLKKVHGFTWKIQALFYLAVHRDSFLRKILSPVHSAIVAPDSEGLISTSLTTAGVSRCIHLRHGNYGY